MSKRLSTCTGSTKSMHRINYSLFWNTLYANDCKQLHLFYALPGETSRGLMYSFKARHGNCMHRRTCVVSKCLVLWKTVPFHDEKLMKNTLYIPETIPSCTETREKNDFYETDFLVSILKISMITSSTTWRSSFTYSAWLMWSPLRDRTMRNVQSPSLKTSDEEFLRKITDLEIVCLSVFCDCMESASNWVRRANWLD